MLNHDYYHSVRDERSKEYVEKALGLKAINTGCVTMWMLTPEFCKTIPRKKAERVVFTLTGTTDKAIVDPEDQFLIDVLQRSYRDVYFWIQGDQDLLYLKQMKNIEGINIIPPSLRAYDSLLSEDDLDYVGTRLHGGVYAMRHGKRAIIIAIDERAREINKGNNLNCIEKSDVPKELEKMILSEFSTEIDMPFDEISRWKEQFIV